MTRLGLALGGGGARGFAHIPILELLDELGVRPTVLSGCSMGAIVGALYAAGCSGREIRDIVEHRDLENRRSWRSFVSTLRSVALDLIRLKPEWRRGGLINVDQLLDHLLEPLEGKEFGDLDPPLVVVATDFWRAEEVALEEGPVIPAIRASAALPGLIAPPQMEGRVLVDGGLVNEVPYDHLFDRCDFVVAVRVSGLRDPEEERRPSGMEAALGAIDVLQAKAFELRVADRRPDVLLEPTVEDVEMLEFNRASEVMEQCGESVRRLREALVRAGIAQ